MANDMRGEVEFSALGQTWTLKFGNGAMRSIEAETGQTMATVGQEVEHGNITLFTTMFRAGLLRHHPDVSLEQCDDIIDDIGQENAGKLIGRAFATAQPPAKGGASRPPKATAASTGRR